MTGPGGTTGLRGAEEMPMAEIIGESIDNLIDALYACVCGPAGQERDWDKMRSLFIPGARVRRADVPEGGCTHLTQLSIQDFIASIEGFIHEKGFYGQELVRRAELSGRLADVTSVYEGRIKPDDPQPFRCGTNKIRLYHDGFRWWIISMLLREFRADDLDPET